MINQTVAQKVGQFFFPAVFINDTEEHIQETERLIATHNIGGLTFFHSRASAATNYESKKKIVFNDDSYQKIKELIVRYQKCAPTPLLISIDAEWGLAMRIEKTPQYPYAITLGALPEKKSNLVYEVGKQIGLDLKAAGIHYNLSPLADINNNPNNPVIGYRSFGENKEKVANFAVEYLRGMSDAGILGCLKHFPGHGNTNVDSHLGLPVLNETLDELMHNELYPFIKGIENNVDSIMIGHLAVPSLNDGKNTSATLSQNVIQHLLREQLGYDGLVISDALNMHSVSMLYPTKGQLEWEAFNAGNDVLCFAENVAEGIEEILKNATVERIEESFKRILKCKEKVGLINGTFRASGELNFDNASALNLEIAANSITKIIDNANHDVVFEAQKNNQLAKLSLYKNIENTFFATLNSNLKSPEFAFENLEKTTVSSIEKNLENFETIIISLFVPKAKPMNNFEIDDDVVKLLSKLLQTKKCIVYVFGNPYVLPIIPNLNKASGLIEVYQDFEEFQKNAAIQLLENKNCFGKLPVIINIQ
ncbi:glycoside hydrolase family 3 N-terminal domain-containing protein [Flavobacterium sp. Fl-77]|uniref:beta-N-acetylhexosaminidase n=1 Tax=Flavobacterium flavipigmentatum TaxID=2893884 RepID=A0AAJ2S970_9FLAO|nr:MULTISPECIES: glycoside hydrolase family 3 N-terminal domain-containing protein [unclassified Flavobacterium]MDX6182012.1 glycoside hydrolase family 3 N-terminal domain-containing protein [Flavobacterium sp. Fl-33]MDX6186933.1 glycoside hydrolase family 3 N-terminal domain-containing protein [Flavobacterium sp. Fl-77]UFH37067.1 glycoside hydrolase family 3 protein [Flavobacterium sp. F-70]